MKVFRIILRVLKILEGLHDYASQKKHENEQQESSTCQCQTPDGTQNEDRPPTD